MYNKVEYNGETLIDLTDTTAEESDVLQGKQFHDRSGALRNGNFVPQSYTAGAGIDITNGEISAKVDGTTIDTNNNNELKISQDFLNIVNNKSDKEGNWELINEITTDTAVNAISISQDTQNNNISLIACFAEISVPKITTADETNYIISRYMSGNTWINYQGFNTSTSSAIKYYHDSENDRGMFKSKLYTNAGAFAYNKVDVYKISNLNITNYRLYSNDTTKTFPIGTNVKLYGIKERQ